ncbi:MAG: glycosyltransferase [Bacteroidota bacterium]
MNKNSLLILSLDSYSVFNQKTSFPFGGIEIENKYHAVGLSSMFDMEVVVITRDQGDEIIKSKRLTIVPHPFFKGQGYWDSNKLFFSRLKKRINGEKNVFGSPEEFYASFHADFTYMQGLTQEILDFARYSKKSKKKFIFKLAHDNDLGGEILSDSFFKSWSKLSLREVEEVYSCADIILVQTPYQKDLLLKRFNRESIILFSPTNLVVDESNIEKKYDVIWVGKDKSFKRPEKLIQIAHELPYLKFIMLIHNPSNELLSTMPSNVEVLDFVPPDNIESFFKSSKLFLSTSLKEGFANTFLHAAKFGVPVISMGSDPNGMLSEHLAGVLSGDDISNTVLKIKQLILDKDYYSQVSAAAKKYVYKFHDCRLITEQFHRILTSLN